MTVVQSEMLKKFQLVFGAALAIALSLLATFNNYVLLAFVAISFFFILIVNKKLLKFIFMSPFFALSLIPASYVSVFRISSPLGELRPSLILVFIALAVIPFIGKVNLGMLGKNKGLLISLSLFFLVCLLSIVENDLGFANFQYSFFTSVYSLAILILVSLYANRINVVNIFKTVIVTSTIVCIIGVVEFLGFQPYSQFYLIDNPWYNYNVYSSQGLHRIVSSMGNPLILSAYLLICLPIVLHLVELEPKRKVWKVVVVLHVLSILLTQSRSAYVVLAIILMLYSIGSIKKMVKSLSILFVIVSTFYVILRSFGLTQSFADRLFFRTQAESYSIRADAYRITREIVTRTDNLLGVGPNMVNQ